MILLTFPKRIPAIDDPNTGITIWESGAIIEYLIDTYDKDSKLTLQTFPEKYHLKQMLHFQVSGQGPYFGQASWFGYFHPEKLPSAIERYQNEVKRVTIVLDEILKKNGGGYLVGGKCTCKHHPGLLPLPRCPYINTTIFVYMPRLASATRLVTGFDYWASIAKNRLLLRCGLELHPMGAACTIPNEGQRFRRGERVSTLRCLDDELSQQTCCGQGVQCQRRCYCCEKALKIILPASRLLCLCRKSVHLCYDLRSIFAILKFNESKSWSPILTACESPPVST